MSNYENNEKVYEPSSEDFTFVQVDKKIYDKKFETKTTTFAKDAFKRFCKNKSSVVGAIIIGILLVLSFLMPVVIPYDIDRVDTKQALLKPKLFKAGTGFWDGTEKYYDQPYNGVTETPQGFKKSAVIKILDHKVTITNNEGPNVSGGYIHIRTSAGKVTRTNPYLQNYTPIYINQDGGYKAIVTLGSENGVNGAQLAEYRFTLYESTQVKIVDKKEVVDENGKPVIDISKRDDVAKKHGNVYLSDWSNDFSMQDGKIVLDLSEYLKQINVEEIEYATLRIEMKPNRETDQYLLVESVEFTADNVEDQEVLEKLNASSFFDANQQILSVKDELAQFPTNYWQASVKRELYKGRIETVSFVYDVYEASLGLYEKYVVGGSEIQEYIDKGWCEYEFGNIDSFKIKDERCPILKVYKETYNKELDAYNLIADIQFYKYAGYDTMPKYLLGTNAVGKDLIKLAFVSLRTSLLIAICTSAICLAFGLVWGSISGYFGGNVDLAMERFCEILSGVPFIVVMTLAILHLGNNIFTFAMALCLTGWLGVAGRTRTQFYRFKGREYILASRTLGSSDRRLIFRHILPNALGTIVTGSVLMIPSVIFSESTLAYLNLGLQGVESFGVLLSSNQKYLQTEPALIVFPAIIISLLMISFNLFGNGLRDALNPSLKGSE